jgi:exopolysaccharide biosynthesis polyprenyl glycosylphosphotransferase
MTQLPGSRVWTWSKTALAAAGFTVCAWAVGLFEADAWLGAVVAGTGLALLLRLLAVSKERRGASSEGVLILGASRMAARLIAEMDAARDPRFRLIGAVDDSAEGARVAGVTPVLGRLDQFHQVVAATRPRRIVMAMSDRRGRVPARTLLESRFRGILVEDAVDFFERVTGKLAIEAMRPSSLILSAGFGHTELYRSRFVQALRGAACRAVAALGLIAVSPLLALIAVAIKLDSPGPIFFIQNRVGRGGRPFGLVKFRTMRSDQGARTSEWVSDNTSRITALGKWLRRFRIDEVPQLINVLRGEMNIVGPRPHPVSNYELFLKHIPYYEFRSLVRPGITGWAQVRYGYANDLYEETEKMRYDFYYIKHRTLALDLRIILETFGVLLFDRRSHQAARPRLAPDALPDPNSTA